MEVKCEAQSCMERLRGLAPDLRVLIEIVVKKINREIIKENEKGATAAERVRNIQNGEEGEAMMEFNQAARRLKRFIDAAEKLSYIPYASVGDKVVKLSDVRQLLCNLHDGHEPDYITPPDWSRKDCVGHLMERGWKLTADHVGLHRRGYFIPAEAIINSGTGGSKSTADTLESEMSERTDRPDIR